MNTKTRFAIRLVHFNAGWRYWAFDANTGYDEEYGLSPNGYGTREEAEKAIQNVSR